MGWGTGLWQAGLLAMAATLFVMLAGRIEQGRGYLWAVFALVAGGLLAGGAWAEGAGLLTADARTLAMGSFIAASAITLAANAVADRLAGGDKSDRGRGRDQAATQS